MARLGLGRAAWRRQGGLKFALTGSAGVPPAAGQVDQDWGPQTVGPEF